MTLPLDGVLDLANRPRGTMPGGRVVAFLDRILLVLIIVALVLLQRRSSEVVAERA